MPCSLWARVRVPGASAAAIMAIPCQMSAERAARPATLYLVSEGGSVGVCLSRLLAEDFGRDTVCDLTKLEIPGLPVGRFVQPVFEVGERGCERHVESVVASIDVGKRSGFSRWRESQMRLLIVDSCPLKASDCTGFMQYGTRSLAVRLLMITLKIMTLGLKG